MVKKKFAGILSMIVLMLFSFVGCSNDPISKIEVLNNAIKTEYVDDNYENRSDEIACISCPTAAPFVRRAAQEIRKAEPFGSAFLSFGGFDDVNAAASDRDKGTVARHLVADSILIIPF